MHVIIVIVFYIEYLLRLNVNWMDLIGILESSNKVNEILLKLPDFPYL